MVVPVPAEAIAAMEQTNNSEILVTAFYGDVQTIPSDAYPNLDRVPITTDGSLTWDAGGQIQCNGNMALAASGRSLVPQSKTDPLAPFGQELQIVRRVRYANTFWDIPGGRLRIQDVPDAQSFYSMLGWAAELTVCDRFDIIQAAEFIGAYTPAQNASTWDEIAAISPIPVVRSLPDATIPAGLTFQSRLEAIASLIGNLGGEPALTRDGALTARPQNSYLTATDPVAVVNGTVKVSGGMSNDVVNSVAVTNPNDAEILGIARIDDPANPLCITGPLGERTRTFSNPLMTTNTAARKAAQTSLARLSTVQARTIKVTCLPRWDIEVGDFIQVNELQPDAGGPELEVVDEFGEDFSPAFGQRAAALTSSTVEWLGEVRKITWPWDPTALMSLELTVADKR